MFCDDSHRPVALVTLCLSLCTLCLGCAPVFSDLQDARVLGPGGVELTPSVSGVYYANEGESQHVQDNLTLQIGKGVGQGTDIRFQYTHVGFDLGDAGIHVVGLGPKHALIPDRLAFYLPIGCAFGGDIDTEKTWQIHPTLLTTLPASAYVDVNSSLKLLIPISSDSDPTLALNLGLGLHSRSSIVVVRPEAGCLWNPDGDGVYWAASLGISVRSPRHMSVPPTKAQS
jgi:hypothetical protein